VPFALCCADSAWESKQKARNALARYLSGYWDGRSTRVTENPNGTTSETVTEWSNCELVFNIGDGRITGSGHSVWQKELIPFIISGAFDRKLSHVHLIKTHVDSRYNTVTHYSLALNTTGPVPFLDGTYKFGKLSLKKMTPQPGTPSGGAGAGRNGAEAKRAAGPVVDVDAAAATKTPSSVPPSIMASSSPFASAFAQPPAPFPANGFTRSVRRPLIDHSVPFASFAKLRTD
jgi:hypothetical protein